MIDIEKYEEKLTPLAREYYDKLIEEYKINLLKSIDNLSAIPKEEITLENLKNLNDEKKHVNEKFIKKTRYLRIIAFVGIVYAIIGGIIYLLQNYKFDFNTDLGIVLAIMGLLLSFFALSINFINKNKIVKTIENVENNKYSIVEKWNTIEAYVRKKLSKVENVEESVIPIRIVLDYIMENYIDSEIDKKKLKDLINTRNEIVHGSIGINREGIERYMEFLEYLNWNIKKKDKL